MVEPNFKASHRLNADVDEILELELLPEQMEMLLDALVFPNRESSASLPPRLRELKDKLQELLNEIEREEGAEKQRRCIALLVEELRTGSPFEAKRLENLTPDELEHELERAEKYWPPDLPKPPSRNGG